jgi:hypothetical protein
MHRRGDVVVACVKRKIAQGSVAANVNWQGKQFPAVSLALMVEGNLEV